MKEPSEGSRRESGPSTMASDDVAKICERLGLDFDQLGVIVVDHGSRRNESNEALLEVVDLFRKTAPYRHVEAAHMELAEPTIQQAYDKLVDSGSRFVVVHPYFLLPGRHWDQDIPALAAQAAKNHPDVKYAVTAPLGIHELMSRIMHHRIVHCLINSADGE